MWELKIKKEKKLLNKLDFINPLDYFNNSQKTLDIYIKKKKKKQKLLLTRTNLPVEDPKSQTCHKLEPRATRSQKGHNTF